MTSFLVEAYTPATAPIAAIEAAAKLAADQLSRKCCRSSYLSVNSTPPPAGHIAGHTFSLIDPPAKSRR